MLAALALIGQSLIVHALKDMELRARPLADPALREFLQPAIALVDHRSFPSGHCASTAAIAALFWLLAGRRRARDLVWLVVILMMLDRVVLGVHFVSDTLTGTAIGLAAMGVVPWLLRVFPGADRAGSTREPAGSCSLRGLIGLALVPGLFWVWRAPWVAWDPVTGEELAGFHSEPHLVTVCLEPFLGVALFLAGEPARATFVALMLAGAATFGFVARWRSGRGASLRALLVAGLWAGAVLVVYRAGCAPPDRYVSRRAGVFVDWHLHGGDPADSWGSAETVLQRQRRRGVVWPLLSWHAQPGPVGAHSHGVVASEWSGTDYPRTDTPHLLMVGPRSAVDQANQTADPVEAVRRARAAGALVLLNHGPRTLQNHLPMPALEDLLAAGLSGFEVANRRREPDPAARSWYASVDRLCRERGLLRMSFSDDHGTPAGSPCVTFLEGVEERDLQSGRGPDIVARFADPDRRDPALVQPMLWNRPWLGEGWVGRVLRPVAYFRSRTPGQLVSWFLWLAPAVFWVLPRRRRNPA